MEGSDERDGFSMGRVIICIGSTREGRMSDGVSKCLPASACNWVGLENGVRVHDKAPT